MEVDKKLIIKSRQDYNTHIDEFEEEFTCSIKEEGEGLIIEFEDGTIIIEDNRLTQKRGENKIIIEPNKINECDYETEQGMFVLDIKGIEVEKMAKAYGTVAKAKYQILIVGVEPYINEIEIIIE